MLTLNKTQSAFRDLERAAAEAGRNVRKEAAIVVNKTGRKGKSIMAKQITEELATTQKVVRGQIEVVGKANRHRQSIKLRLKASQRIPLKEFKARQTKKGVSYKTSKRRGRQTIPGAFIVDKYDGNVYKRPGKSRAVGGRKKGPSPWGVYVKNRYRPQTVKNLDAELRKQLVDRARFIRLKMEGKI